MKNEIDGLIRHSYLEKFVRKEGTRSSEQGPTQIFAQSEVDNQPTKKLIGMIFSGTRPTLKWQKKKKLQINVISFSDNDLARIHNLYNDAIVIARTIVKHIVKRILVDNKSFDDVHFYDAFVQMGLPPS